MASAISPVSGAREPGEQSFWPGDNPPSGALVRDGSAVSRTLYANLFAAIGTKYGAGDGSTTFNLPDDIDEFIRGVDGVGRSVGSTQGDLYRSHNHNFWGDGHNSAGSYTATVAFNHGTSHQKDASAVRSNGGSETRPQNRGYLPIIWY